jgi:hypothetical protein
MWGKAVDRAGEFAAENEGAAQVLRAEVVGGDVDDLTGVDVIARAQRSCGIDECHRLPDPSRTSQDDELVVYGSSGDVVQHRGTVAKVEACSVSQHAV